MASRSRTSGAARRKGKEHGSMHLHAYPEIALNEIASFPAAGADARNSQAEFAAFIQSTPKFTAKTNWHGHVVVGAIIISPDQKFVALVRRAETGAYEFPYGHITEGDKTLDGAALREACFKTGLPAMDLDRIYNGPIFLHTETNKRGQQPEHPHYVVSYLFQAHSNHLTGLAHQQASWVLPNALEARLGAKAQAVGGLISALTEKLG